MVPLIDREIFFGNPVIMGGQISPDGKFVSFIKPFNGMLNIWIKNKEDSFEEATPLTNDQSRPITSYFWTRDSKYILYVQDKGGDENFHIYVVDPLKAGEGIPESRDLTNYAGIRAVIYALPKDDHNKILVGLNDRDHAWHDLYAVNIDDASRVLIEENTQRFNAFYFDLDYNLRIASRSTNDAGTEILSKIDDKWKSLISCSGDEYLSPLKFLDKDSVYLETNMGDANLSILAKLDTKTGVIEKIESDPQNKVDLGGAIFSDRSDKLIGTVYTFKKSEIYWRDKDFESDYLFLKNHFNQAEISLASGTEDENEWIIGVNSDTDPGATFFFNRETRNIEFLYRPRPNLPIEHLCEMHPISFTSTDNLVIHGYLTKPKGEDEKYPGIIMPHGGPWVRDTWGYNSYAQFLANRGYCVLQVNYRGSTGYGKSFLNAGDREWGMKMQEDLTNGARFLADNDHCHPEKIGILGGSYGGYATLAGLTFTPDVYACGVSIVGPSNLFTLLESIPPYWETARAMFHKRMGDPTTEDGKERLRQQSPFFHASNIKVPLLVAQGDNDPRVKTAESEQIVSAMKDHNLPVGYLNFPDEGHGFANPENSMAFIAVMEKFLAKNLGGRFQEEIPERLQTIINNVTVEDI